MQADTLPDDLDRARALSPRYYVGDAMLAMEQRAVFARSWQLVAHQGLLAEPGDHAVEQIAGVPVLLVRGQDGVLRAFPNVCRHRAGPLALCNGKGAKALHCKYHGWTYTLAGQLRSAPEMQDACDFKVEDIRLPSLRVHEWQGLVFVALSDDVPAFEPVPELLTAPAVAPARLVNVPALLTPASVPAFVTVPAVLMRLPETVPPKRLSNVPPVLATVPVQVPALLMSPPTLFG